MVGVRPMASSAPLNRYLGAAVVNLRNISQPPLFNAHTRDSNYSRRYGVIDNRFCFEGGTNCGKGEGLYVMVTDQGDDITQTLKAAAQGKLASKRRPVARKISGNSPYPNPR